MEIRIKVNEWKTLIIYGRKAEDFKAWLNHECDGAEPTEELFEEFNELEEEFREPLINACYKCLS